jgi:hypothetical protein
MGDANVVAFLSPSRSALVNPHHRYGASQDGDRDGMPCAPLAPPEPPPMSWRFPTAPRDSQITQIIDLRQDGTRSDSMASAHVSYLATNALILQSREHMDRIPRLIECSHGQARIARALMDESQRYMMLIEQIEMLIEQIEASRIDWRRENSN